MTVLIAGATTRSVGGESSRTAATRAIAADVPCLAWDEVLYNGEPVALVAAATPEQADTGGQVDVLA